MSLVGVKTGPTGVIASTMREAFEVAETMAEDFTLVKLTDLSSLDLMEFVIRLKILLELSLGKIGRK